MGQPRGASGDGDDAPDRSEAGLHRVIDERIAEEIVFWLYVLESVALESVARGALASELEDVETPLEEYGDRVRAHGDFQSAVADVRMALDRFGANLVDDRMAEALTLRALGIYAPIDPLDLSPLFRHGGSFFAIRDRHDATRMGAAIQPGQIWVRLDGMPRKGAKWLFDLRDWATDELGLPALKTGRRKGATDPDVDEFARTMDIEASDELVWSQAVQLGLAPGSGRYQQYADPRGNDRRRRWVGRIRARAAEIQDREWRTDEAIRRADPKTTIRGERVWYEVRPGSGQRIARRPRNWR